MPEPTGPVHAAAAPRADAAAKVTGTARYTADVRLPGMLHAKVLRSPHAHARLVSVDASRARALPGVHAVLTRDELDGIAPGYGYFVKDQPVVALDTVRYAGDVVAAVAAGTEAVALEAVKLTVGVKPPPLPRPPKVTGAMFSAATLKAASSLEKEGLLSSTPPMSEALPPPPPLPPDEQAASEAPTTTVAASAAAMRRRVLGRETRFMT